MQRHFRLLPLLAFLAFSSPIRAKAIHPLDPLDETEITRAVKILKGSKNWNANLMFPYLMLKEPPKSEVLAFTPGAKFRREAFAVLSDRKTSAVYEVTVDLNAVKVTEWKEIAGAHAPVMLSEFEAVPPIVKADPGFREAMKRRGITDLNDVAIDVWAYGSPDSEHSAKSRLFRTLAYYQGKGKNFYARPIDGLTVIVNMNEKKVEKIVDTEVLPLPPQPSDLDEKAIGPKREPVKPLVISQPQGVSYSIHGNEIRWQNWSFHYVMHPREGLVVQLVKYRDHGKWRSILYRGSLSEMMVPYGHKNEHWNYRAAFDEGEYGIGRYSGSLEKGTDVPANAQLFDGLFVDDFGKPYRTKNVVALYERDGGVLWKHRDMYHGGNFSRRARELVIGFITTVTNYEYGINWVFHQDGTLEVETQLTGIMLAKGSRVVTMDGHDHSGDLGFGHLVAPNVVAPHHQHFFNFRLDMDIDGTENRVAELGTYSVPEGPDNPALNAFKMVERDIKSESEGARDLDYASQRKWKIYNPAVKNALGYPSSYVLLPAENSNPYMLENSPLLKRGGFIAHPVWFTQQSDSERYAAGPYPLQRPDSDGLPKWTKANRSLEGKDVVLWYTFCVTHTPRPEEWPVMNTYRTGFKLLPAGFFDRNPAFDVPR